MITNGKEPHVNKIRVGIKKLNNLLSLAKIPLQVATQTGHILVEINPAPDFCKFVCQKSSSILCDTCVSRLQDKNNSDFFTLLALSGCIILPFQSFLRRTIPVYI